MRHRTSPRQRRRNRPRPPVVLQVQKNAQLNDQRQIPDDHPTATKASLFIPDSKIVRDRIDAVERSGVLEPLARRLRDHPGKTSVLPLKALLVAMVMCLRDRSSALRTDLCAALNGFEAADAAKLGLSVGSTRTLISYHIVAKQCRRLEKALEEGWVDSVDGTVWGEDWFINSLTAATGAAEAAALTNSLALDSTFTDTFAVSKEYRSERQLRTERAAGTLTAVTPGGLGDVGPDGRTIRSNYDRDARPGHRSATGKQKARLGFGYDAHFLCVTRKTTWAGNPKEVKLSDHPRSYILHGDVVPAGTDPGPVGLSALQWVSTLVDVDEVLADQGYTPKQKSFTRPLHQAGINVVMDHSTKTVNRPYFAELGKHKQRVLVHCGTIFPEWLPEEMHQPPPELTGKKLRDWYDTRAKFRWSQVNKRRDGTIRLNCPQCAGRITTKAETRNKNVKLSASAVDIPRDPAAEYCCDGPLNVPVEQADYFQEIPFGTTAWKASYSRRLGIESINGLLKNQGALKSGWCRSRHRVACALATALLCFSHNLDLDLDSAPP